MSRPNQQGGAARQDGFLETAGRALAAGALAEARHLYERVLQASPDHPEALFGLGNTALQLGRPEEAVHFLQRAIDRRAGNPRYHGNLGIALHRLGRLDQAIAAYRRALECDPAYVRAYIACGRALTEAGKAGEALACLAEAQRRDPHDIDASNATAIAYAALGRVDEAERAYRNGIRTTEKAGWTGPRRAAAGLHFNLGNLLFAQGRLEQALACYESATRRDPGLVEARCNLAKLLRERGDFDGAAANLEAAIAAEPRSIEAHTQLGIARLAQGDFARGWVHYERRLEAGARARRYRLAPEWRGEDLNGRTLYVFREQGIGDELMFASMYEELTTAAGRCVIECRPKLRKLLSRSVPRAEFVEVADSPETRADCACDFQVSAGSLGRVLRTDAESFPERAAYLRADVSRVAYWKNRLRTLGPGPSVGISWRSSIATADRRLEYSVLDDWEVVFSVPRVSFVCLQYDECTAELASAAERFGVTVHLFPDIDLLDDLDDVAALIVALDLVVSAPTAVSRQAAALGSPTWQLAFGRDWREHGTARNLWLPALRTFPRAWNQTWPEVLAEVGAALRAFAGRHGAGP